MINKKALRLCAIAGKPYKLISQLKIIRNDIQRSARIIQKHLDKGNISVFCGAGISISSGIPSVKPIIEKVLSELGCSTYDINRFLKKDTLPIPFESVIQVFKETLTFGTNKFFIEEFIRLFRAEPNSLLT